jgi:hypothetical protein
MRFDLAVECKVHREHRAVRVDQLVYNVLLASSRELLVRVEWALEWFDVLQRSQHSARVVA